MISKQSSLEYTFILSDEITRAMIDPLVDCRKLWGGPFNPKFDVCKNLEDTLKKVNCNIHFLSKRLKTPKYCLYTLSYMYVSIVLSF